jgi:hypothetical protein
LVGKEQRESSPINNRSSPLPRSPKKQQIWAIK